MLPSVACSEPGLGVCGRVGVGGRLFPLRIPIALFQRLDKVNSTWRAVASLCSSCYPLLDLNSPSWVLAHKGVASFFTIFECFICLLKGELSAQTAQGCVTDQRKQLVMTQHCRIPTLPLSPAPRRWSQLEFQRGHVQTQAQPCLNRRRCWGVYSVKSSLDY